MLVAMYIYSTTVLSYLLLLWYEVLHLLVVLGSEVLRSSTSDIQYRSWIHSRRVSMSRTYILHVYYSAYSMYYSVFPRALYP